MLLTQALVFILNYKLIFCVEKALHFKSIDCELPEEIVMANYSCEVKSYGTKSTLNIVTYFKKPITSFTVSFQR